MPKGVQVRMEGQRDLYLGAKVDSSRGMVYFIALALKMELFGQVRDIPQDSPLGSYRCQSSEGGSVVSGLWIWDWGGREEGKEVYDGNFSPKFNERMLVTIVLKVVRQECL